MKKHIIGLVAAAALWSPVKAALACDTTVAPGQLVHGAWGSVAG